MRQIEIGAVSDVVRKRLELVQSDVVSALQQASHDDPTYWTTRTIGSDDFVTLIVGDETVIALPESFVENSTNALLASIVRNIICGRSSADPVRLGPN
jgi:hypothetical protein